MDTAMHVVVIGVLMVAFQSCGIPEFIRNGTLDDYVYQEKAFCFTCDDGAEYRSIWSARSLGYGGDGKNIFVGFKNNDPTDTLAIGCLDIHGGSFSGRNKKISLLILRVPNKDLGSLNTSIELDPQNQSIGLSYIIKDSYYEDFESVPTVIESGHIQFSSFSPEFWGPSNAIPIIGTFDLAGHFTTKDGEVLPFKISDGYFHAYLTEGEYR